MAGIRSASPTLAANGEKLMDPETILGPYPNNDIKNGSLLTMESNHFGNSTLFRY